MSNNDAGRLDPDEIQKALHAGRVVDLRMPAVDGPLGLEHLAAAMEELQSEPPTKSDVNRE